MLSKYERNETHDQHYEMEGITISYFDKFGELWHNSALEEKNV